MRNKELVREALEARKQSYCPYSGFAVGAALLCGDADGVIVVPEDFLPYLETAEKKEAVEIARREFLANGGIYNKRPDFDVVKLFEYDMDKNIQNIKNNECKYD